MNDHIAASGKPISLEAVLLELATYGKPWVWIFQQGWTAKCDMQVDARGVDFVVRADFEHMTPLAAATQCLGRVKAAVKEKA